MRELGRTRTLTVPLSQTVEREIAEILTQVAPRRQPDGVARRVITVLCVNIHGFVGHCECLEPEQVGAILDLYTGAMADSIGTYFGTLHAVLGACMLASWNAVQPQADHALLAVSAAIDMIDRTDDINRRLRAEGLPEIGCAIGVNTGDALVRPSGLHRGERDVIGDSVNVAHLLAGLAPAGGILIAEGTKVSLGGEILVERVEIDALPGKEKLVRVYRVLGRLTPL